MVKFILNKPCGLLRDILKFFFFFFFLCFGCTGAHSYVQAFSSFGKRRLLFVAVHGLLIPGASLLQHVGSSAHWLQYLHCGFSGCARASHSRGLPFAACRLQRTLASVLALWIQWLRCTGLVAPWHVKSSQAKD